MQTEQLNMVKMDGGWQKVDGEDNPSFIKVMLRLKGCLKGLIHLT